MRGLDPIDAAMTAPISLLVAVLVVVTGLPGPSGAETSTNMSGPHLSQKHAAAVEVCPVERQSCSTEKPLENSVAFGAMVMGVHDGAGVLSAWLGCSYTGPPWSGQSHALLTRSDEDRSLEAMGYIASEDVDGFRYQLDW